MKNKQKIRKTMLELRGNLCEDEIAILSADIKQKLQSIKCVQEAHCIMAYCSHKGEVSLHEFMHECLDDGKRIALPCIVSNGVMIATEYAKNSALHLNKYGIFEPTEISEINPDEIDVIIVPAVAFDESLNRIGYGGGYYDRFLRSIDAIKIGVGFDFQIVKRLPISAHDMPLNLVVSEKRVIGTMP